MSTNAIRHTTLLRFQLRIWSIVAAFLLIFTAGMGASQLSHHREVDASIASAEARAHFWQVVAGNESATSDSVSNTLATELHNRLGEINPNATRLPQAITAYHGTTNLYGGIREALGVDPFVESSGSCQYCGPLTQDFKQRLLRIKRGEVAELIHSERPAEAGGYKLTPLGLSSATTGLIIWLVGGPIVLVAANSWARSSRRGDYDIRHFGDLSWKLDGECDGTKLTTVILVPSFFVPYGIWRRSNRKRFDQKVREKFGTEMLQIDELDHELARISLKHGNDSRVLELQQARDDTLAELQSLTRSGQSSDVDYTLARLNNSMDEIRGRLEARKQFLNQQEAPPPPLPKS